MRVIVIANPSAGASADPSPQTICDAFEKIGVHCDLPPVHDTDITQITRRALEFHPDAIIASGGDGTISAVASALVKTDVPLGIVPAGTLNHFAKDLAIPTDLPAAVRTIVAFNVRAIDVAQVNGHTFINNSSIGLYPHIVRQREQIRERLGRGKWIAMLMAFLNVFRRYPTVNVRINSPDLAFARKTPFVFIGNNRYHISLNMLGTRDALDRGELCVYFTNRSGRFALLRLALRTLFGRLDQDKDFHSLSATELRIDTNRKSIHVAADGEVLTLTPPLHYRILPRALKILAPK